MSTCKDCLHDIVCPYSLAEVICDDFKDRSKFVEVVNDHNVGDICIYSFDNGNKSLAIVEIVKILNDARGVAEIKFIKVIADDTGNGFFSYLLKVGHTMNASLKYLKNITPCCDKQALAERSDGDET